MVDQHDAAVVDNHLAGKEDDGLEGLLRCIRKAERIRNAAPEFDASAVVGDGEGCRICNYNAGQSITESDQDKGANKANRLLNHKVECKAAKAARSLNETAPRA